MNLVKVSAVSQEAALGASNAGIDFMHKNFQFIDPNDLTKISSFNEFMAKPAEPFKTGVVEGVQRGGKPLVVPYKSAELHGQQLKKQLEKWASYGTIEPDAAAAISKLADKEVDLTGHHFVLIGAGSAMGPFIKLLEHGATVIAIDIPGKWGPNPQKMWQRLIDTAKRSSGKMLFPLSVEPSACPTESDLIAAAGCNLTEQPSQILAWLESIAPGERLTIGNYTYLDGELHVKLSLAADALIKGLCAKRKETAIAFLCTPTDIHTITDEAHAAAKANFGFHPGRLVEGAINALSFGRFLRKNALKPILATDGSTIKVLQLLIFLLW